jgi:hypothetical protein
MEAVLSGDVAFITGASPLITDIQSALDVTAAVYTQYGVTKLVLNKDAFCEDFFRLSTGLAGEIVQKFVNYRFRVAIVGDFSRYTSKALRDYMYECNKGNHLYFVADRQQALEKLKG